MVEVVQQASAKECKCHKCKATLRYVFADITTRVEKDYLGDGDEVHRIICPNCGATPSVPRW